MSIGKDAGFIDINDGEDYVEILLPEPVEPAQALPSHMADHIKPYNYNIKYKPELPENFEHLPREEYLNQEPNSENHVNFYSPAKSGNSSSAEIGFGSQVGPSSIDSVSTDHSLQAPTNIYTPGALPPQEEINMYTYLLSSSGISDNIPPSCDTALLASTTIGAPPTPPPSPPTSSIVMIDSKEVETAFGKRYYWKKRKGHQSKVSNSNMICSSKNLMEKRAERKVRCFYCLRILQDLEGISLPTHEKYLSQWLDSLSNGDIYVRNMLEKRLQLKQTHYILCNLHYDSRNIASFLLCRRLPWPMLPPK